jgi:hypothetical protein
VVKTRLSGLSARKLRLALDAGHPFRITCKRIGKREVWKARDTHLGRIVAIRKVKQPNRERFKQEARSITALNRRDLLSQNTFANWAVWRF